MRVEVSFAGVSSGGKCDLETWLFQQEQLTTDHLKQERQSGVGWWYLHSEDKLLLLQVVPFFEYMLSSGVSHLYQCILVFRKHDRFERLIKDASSAPIKFKGLNMPSCDTF